MLALRRLFFDGAARPELVLLHCSATLEGSPGGTAFRSTCVVPPSAEPGRREARVFLPSPPVGGRFLVRYFFSTVENGDEWFSPVYEEAVPGEGVNGDLVQVEEAGRGNVPPPEGMGTFRILLPVREGAPPEGTVRYGYGAMRKKPSPDLCRARVHMDGDPPVVEIPRTLSVLKSCPMPFFLYHIPGDGGGLAADKINCARLTMRDETGDVLCSRVLWSDPAWKAQNLSIMEVRNFSSEECRAADVYFSADREAWLKNRSEALARHPVPRTFEAYVFGPEGSVVEYCFQVLRRRSDGTVTSGWRNRDGGNWSVTL